MRIRQLLVETWPGDESIEVGYEEVHAYFEGLRDLGREAMLQARSADGRGLITQVNGVVAAVEWDRHAPLLQGGRSFDVYGDGWAFMVPERDFVRAEVWLVGHARDGGLTVTLDGATIEAGVARDGPPDVPPTPEQDVWGAPGE